MKQDHFLIAILLAIGLLVVSALVIFFSQQENLEYGEEDTPEGVVRNYLIAIYREDYEQAFSYLQDLENKPDYQDFRLAFLGSRLDTSDISAKISGTEIMRDEAIVALKITHGGTDPFQGTWSNNESALLVLQAGQWKLAQMPYPYWDWEWYP